MTHILISLRLVQSPQHATHGANGRFLTALEDSPDPPKLLGVLSDAYKKKQSKFNEAAAEAKVKGDVPPLPPTVPMALRAAVRPFRRALNCLIDNMCGAPASPLLSAGPAAVW